MKAISLFSFILGPLFCLNAFGAELPQVPRLIIQKNNDLPITIFNLTFQTGSADDPAGLHGIAYLTGRLIREGGVQKKNSLPEMKRAELEEMLFPFAADIGLGISREQISLSVTTTTSDSPFILKILAQMITAPSFDPLEFERIKKETLDYLLKQAPNDDQEELGKTALNTFIFGDEHPYSHAIEGRLSSLRRISLDDIKAFYKTAFTQKRLTIGIAGSVRPDIESGALHLFSDLPVGDAERAKLPNLIGVGTEKGRTKSPKLLVVKGNYSSTGVHLGHLLELNRSSPDFPELYLASTAFGKHRSFVGRLMNRVREIRGLNYGTYSYIEDFPNGGYFMSEPTQAARSQQAFTVWARPTIVENGCFVLRQIMREVENFYKNGLSNEEFINTQSHLVGQLPIQGSSLDRQLGYAIDSLFYGIQGDYLSLAQDKIATSKLESVNAIIQKYIRPDQLKIVVVTQDPENYIKEILGNRCSIQYSPGVEKPKEVLLEDQEIGRFDLNLERRDIRVIEAKTLFE